MRIGCSKNIFQSALMNLYILDLPPPPSVLTLTSRTGVSALIHRIALLLYNFTGSLSNLLFQRGCVVFSNCLGSISGQWSS